MALLVVLLGIAIVGLGLIGSLRHHMITDTVLGWQPRAASLVAIGVRLVFGIVLLLGAADSRFPTLLYVLAGIAIVSAVVLAFLGADRTAGLVYWWFSQPSIVIRVWLLAAVLFGAFLVYAGL